MTEFYADQVLTPEQQQEIGKVSVEAALLEIRINQQLHGGAGISYSVLYGLLLSRKLKMLRKAVNDGTLSNEDKIRFNTLYDQGKLAIAKRNRITHGIWKITPTDVIVYHPKDDVTFSASAIHDVATELAMFRNEIEDFYTLHGNALATLREKSSIVSRFLFRLRRRNRARSK